MDPLPVVIGFAVGVVVGLTSTGGGALLTPALVLVLRVPPAVAVGTDVFIASVMKLFGGGMYAARKAVDWSTALRLATGSLPGATAGLLLLAALPEGSVDGFLRRSLGVVLTLVGIVMLWRLRRRSSSAPPARPRVPSPAATIALGFVTGLLVSTTSVGSGTIVLAVLQSLFPLSAQVAVGTDLIHALILSAYATAGHLYAGRVDVGLAATVLIGAVPGVILGARAAAVVADRPLRLALAVIVVGAGLHLTLSAPSASAHPAPAPLPAHIRPLP